MKLGLAKRDIFPGFGFETCRDDDDDNEEDEPG